MEFACRTSASNRHLPAYTPLKAAGMHFAPFWGLPISPQTTKIGRKGRDFLKNPQVSQKFADIYLDNLSPFLKVTREGRDF